MALKVSLNIENEQSWPVVTLELVTDRDILGAETDAHFHHDPEFLQHIFVVFDPFYGFVPLITCTNLNSPTASLLKFYRAGEGSSFHVDLAYPSQKLV